jgi:hypothetical protein
LLTRQQLLSRGDQSTVVDSQDRLGEADHVLRVECREQFVGRDHRATLRLELGGEEGGDLFDSSLVRTDVVDHDRSERR